MTSRSPVSGGAPESSGTIRNYPVQEVLKAHRNHSATVMRRMVHIPRDPQPFHGIAVTF